MPPVIPDRSSSDITSITERQLLNSYYQKDVGNAYAFQSSHWEDFKFRTIELSDVFRQSDNDFVKALHQVRIGNITILPYFNEKASMQSFSDGIYLCGRKADAEIINTTMLKELNGPSENLFAVVSGPINTKDFPAPETLTVKLGARVMAVVNVPERRITNGMCGFITSLNPMKILFDNMVFPVIIEPYTWTVFDYVIDDIGRIQQREKGKYTQYPLTLAYAITIHKSQGASYEKVNLEPASFAPGQLYVALSRCTSIHNLHLVHPILHEDLICDPAVVAFYQSISSPSDPPVKEVKKRGRPRKTRSLSNPLRVPDELRNDIISAIEMWGTDPDHLKIVCVQKIEYFVTIFSSYMLIFRNEKTLF